MHLQTWVRCACILLLLFGLAGCSSSTAAPPAAHNSPATRQLVVFAAASLQDAFTEIGQKFEQSHPDTRVSFNFAGSQQLALQINEGAPADLFASANEAQMAIVVNGGRIARGTEHTFARNRLVVIYPSDNPAHLQSLQNLARPGLKLILADKNVPAGQYALAFLDKASQDPAFGAEYKQQVLRNVVSYETDVKAVLAKVMEGPANAGDAGIVYSTDIQGAAAGKVGHIDIPDPLNTTVTYPVAPVNDAKQAALAQQFIAYLLSPDGQTVLAKYGFSGAG